MNESDFWDALRFRINRLPAADSEGARLGWCDWFEAKRYILGGPSPRITGRVGFVSGRDAWQLRFVLLVSRQVGAAQEIEWSALLPPEDSAGWLWSEEGGETLVLDPGCNEKAAEPGAAPDR